MITSLAQALSSVFALRKLSYLCEFTPEISEVEQDLADTLPRHSTVKWYQQVPFSTSFCDFFLDMGCLIRPGRAIGIECDGHPYHTDKTRDFCRDALILGTGRLACIYHIEAWAIRKRQVDWMRLLSELEPGLFAPGRLQAIQALARGYDEVTGLKLRERYIGFIYWRTPGMDSVRRFLEFAEANQGISFPKLVERARESEEALGRTSR
jgi:hypothetical protein